MAMISFLLVDDEREFAETFARRLRLKGFGVDCVFSGVEALKYLENNRTVDVVILDIGMPDPGGMKTLVAIKKKYPLIEVIMLTGLGAVHSAVEAMKSGAFDYLTKPADINDFISVSEKAVKRKRLRESEILNVRMKPYITKQERDELISQILETKEEKL